MRLRINLTDYEVPENHLLVIAPTVVREFGPATEDCAVCGMVFTSDFMAQAGMSPKHMELFDFFSANNDPVVPLGPQDVDNLVSLVQVMSRKSAGNNSNVLDKEVINHSFLAFIYEMATVFRKHKGAVSIQLTKKEDLAMRFAKLLNGHFREERSVFFYADLLCVTPKYLTQTVKEVTGKTAGEMIDGMVVMEAKVLLNNMSQSIASVAESLYFSDQFFFSKFFKKHTGLTPTDYRKRV
ncbi:MAG: helix-turn-helix domain-containing protein [Chitinophagaceae bacterium]